MPKKQLLVSFSGGETSAFMAQWLWKHKQNEYDMIFVFANTGQENEETYEFVEQCSSHFGFPIVWVEADVNKERGKGTRHKIVDFVSASRTGEPFEKIIAKYGIPNPATPHCTRDLKAAPINSYAKSIWFKDYYTAIGIRVDEFDRMNEKAKQKRFLYPLINKDMRPMTKPMINFYWSNMPFRLNLKGYQGNCKWCWKKSKPKLIRIAKDNPEYFDFPKSMEEKYGDFVPLVRLNKIKSRGESVPQNIKFFRGNMSAIDILKISETANPSIIDDSFNTNFQLDIFDELDIDLVGGESCEVFSECK